jgi:hypothetical protein
MARVPVIMTSGPFGAAPPAAVRQLTDALVRPQESSFGIVALDDAAVDLAFAEDVAPLLGARVSQGRVTVPPARRAQLLWDHQMCLASNVIRARAVQALGGAFREVAIPIVLLKGIALIQAVMQPGERSMGDVDILVPASRWREACGLMVSAGFTEDRLPERAYTAGHDYVRSFTSPVGVTIEVHRFVCEASFLNIDYEGPDGLFARAKATRDGVSLPEDGDLFLTLAAHAAKHTFELPLRSFLDGLFLLRKETIRLEELAVRARTWRMEAAFAAWLRSLRALTSDANAPDDASNDSTRQRLARLVWSRTGHTAPWQRFVRMAWLSDSAADWARHVATRATFRALDAAQAIGQRAATKLKTRSTP